MCFAKACDSFVIMPDGKLSKCSYDLSYVGNVLDGVELNKQYFYWCNVELPIECEKCIYLPICQGGCRAGEDECGCPQCFLFKEIIPELLCEYVRENR